MYVSARDSASTFADFLFLNMRVLSVKVTINHASLAQLNVTLTVGGSVNVMGLLQPG